MAKNKSGYSLIYEDFEYQGINEMFSYEIPLDLFVDGVKTYFDNQMITLDGKDTDIWNIFNELDCLDTIFSIMEDWLKDYCKDYAYDEYKDYIDWYYDDEEVKEEE